MRVVISKVLTGTVMFESKLGEREGESQVEIRGFVFPDRQVLCA